jgi:hypothetical protein
MLATTRLATLEPTTTTSSWRPVPVACRRPAVVGQAADPLGRSLQIEACDFGRWLGRPRTGPPAMPLHLRPRPASTAWRCAAAPARRALSRPARLTPPPPQPARAKIRAQRRSPTRRARHSTAPLPRPTTPGLPRRGAPSASPAAIVRAPIWAAASTDRCAVARSGHSWLVDLDRLEEEEEEEGSYLLSLSVPAVPGCPRHCPRLLLPSTTGRQAAPALGFDHFSPHRPRRPRSKVCNPRLFSLLVHQSA